MKPAVQGRDSGRSTEGGRVRAAAIRTAVLATHPIQYQAPLWRRLAADTRLDLTVYFGTDMSVRGYRDREFGVKLSWDTPLLEGYRSEMVSTDPTVQHVSFWSPSRGDLDRRLRALRPDVVLLPAYRSAYLLAGAWAARRVGARLAMRHEASDVAEARHPVKARLRDVMLRVLYRRVAAFGAIGIEARRHLERLGVGRDRIHFSPYCVDTEHFEIQVTRWSPRRAELRRNLGIRPEDTALLHCGKLIGKKDPLTVVEAIGRLPADRRERIHLLIAGDGELRPEVEARARPLLGDRLHLLGFLNQSEIGRAYAAADALVLASRRGSGETWGLVVNEAMQFSLPAIVSDGVGCHPDLVVPGGTGFVFPSGEASALGEAIGRVLGLPAIERRAMGAAARERTRAYSLEAAAEGLVRCLVMAGERSRARRRRAAR